MRSRAHELAPARVSLADADQRRPIENPDCPRDLGLLHLWAAVVHGGQAFHIVWFDEPGPEAEDERRFTELLSTWSSDP